MEIPNDVWFHHILPHIHPKHLIYVCKTWYSIYINHIFDNLVIDHKFINKILPYEQSTLLLLRTKEINLDIRDHLFEETKHPTVAKYLLYNDLISIKSSYRAIGIAIMGYIPLQHIIENKVLCVNNSDILYRAIYNSDHVNMEELLSLNINGYDIDRLLHYMMWNDILHDIDRSVYINFICTLIRHPSVDITSHDNVLLVSCLKAPELELVPVLLEQQRVNNISNIAKVVIQNYPHCNSLMKLTGISPLKILSYILRYYIAALDGK